MSAWLDSLVALLLAHRAWAGPVFGLIAFGESLVIAGAIIPATPILLLVGTLIGSGELAPQAMLPWAIAGAILGYWASYTIGRRLGHRLYRHPLFATQHRALARARLFFRRWGAPSLIFGRYLLGPFQSFLPLVAGLSKMEPRRFHVWNIVSGVTWVLVVLTPGYLTGKGLTLPGIGAGAPRMLAGVLVAVSVTGVVVSVTLAGWRMIRHRRAR